jgi:hypothetical protein
MARDSRAAASGREVIHTGFVIPAGRASLMVAFLAAVLAVASCSAPPRCPAGASCPAPPPPKVTFVTTINGRTASPTKYGRPPRYPLRPGAHLSMTVVVTVPRHLRVTDLWLGISAGTWGNGPKGRPIGMNPILAHSRRPLSAGRHTFELHWRIPALRPGGSLYLITAWSSHQPPLSIARAIAVLAPN